MKFPEIKNVFLGMVNYLGKFVPNLSENIKHLKGF